MLMVQVVGEQALEKHLVAKQMEGPEQMLEGVEEEEGLLQVFRLQAVVAAD